MAAERSDGFKSKEKCGTVRNYENHIKEAGEGDEQGAGDDPSRGATEAWGARGGPAAV